MKIKDAKVYFRHLIQQNQLSHAYLLTGMSVNEKRELTQWIVQSIICEKPHANGGACLNCIDCQRVAQGQFADWMTIQPEGKTIKVDQIRGLKDWLSTSPLEASFKIAVIEQADLMGNAAANALLLFLEEPAENVYIFLYSQQADQLLPTIVSRTQELLIVENKIEDQIDDLVQNGIHRQHAYLIKQMGSVDSLVETYQADEFEQWIISLNHFYDLLISRDPYAFVWVQQQLKGNLSYLQARAGIDYLIWLNSYLLLDRYSLSEEEKTNFSSKMLKVFDKVKLSSNATIHHEINNVLFDSKIYLNSNVSPQLVYEKIAIYICRW